MSLSGCRVQPGSVNVTRNVEPRDLADWPACRFIALFFWSWVALITFGPVLLLAFLLTSPGIDVRCQARSGMRAWQPGPLGGAGRSCSGWELARVRGDWVGLVSGQAEWR
jgi:hypothetical protein